MSHRLEVYFAFEHAQTVIDVPNSFGIDAQIIGHVEAYAGKRITIVHDSTTYTY